MSQKSGSPKMPSEPIVKDIRRATRCKSAPKCGPRKNLDMPLHYLAIFS